MSNSNIQITVEKINALNPTDIVNDELVKANFIRIYDTVWQNSEGVIAYEKESKFFNRLVADNENISKYCTKFSIFNAFMDLAVSGLSIEPGSKALCYLQPRRIAIGKDNSGKTIYEGRCTLVVSGYGELVLRARCGQIKYADNPVLVYQEDEFSFSDRNGQKSVDYVCHYPHTSGHIVAAFLRITRADGSLDYAVMYEEDWLRLKTFSEENNKKWDKAANGYVKGDANRLYVSGANGGIDPGFLCAKLIKHAFKTYPKARIGRGSELQSQQPDELVEIDDKLYGVQEPEQPKPAAFGPAQDFSGGVQVDEGPMDDGAF